MTSSKNFEFFIEVDGHRIPEFGHSGKTYIEGRKGKPFVLKFRNNRATRVLVVPSVDGLSVFDGNVATSTSGGYVVQPYSSIPISGWRTSLEDVAKFVFDEKKGSYAEASGKGDQNCGVISCRVFEEYVAPVVKFTEHHHHHQYRKSIPRVTDLPFGYPTTGVPYPNQPYTTCSTSGESVRSVDQSKMLCSASIDTAGAPTLSLNESNASLASNESAPDFNLGTAWGEVLKDAVRLVKFETGELLEEMSLFYSDKAGLESAGIVLDKKVQAAHAFPIPFNGFCKPPPAK